jgi:hypothetical protein
MVMKSKIPFVGDHNDLILICSRAGGYFIFTEEIRVEFYRLDIAGDRIGIWV